MGNCGGVGGDAATGDGGLHAGVHHRVGQHRRNGFTLCIFMHRTIISFVQPQPNSIQNKNNPIGCGTAPGNLVYL